MVLKVVALAAIIFAAKLSASPEECAINHSVLLESFRIFQNGTLLDDVQRLHYPPGTYFKDDEAVRVCPCKIGTAPCLRKCCPLGMAFGPSSKCISSDNIFWVNVTNSDGSTRTVDGKKHFALLNGTYCPSNISYFLDPNSFPEDQFFIRSSDGILTTPNHNAEELGVDHFCLEYSVETDENKVLICVPEDFRVQTESTRVKGIVYPILMLISVPPLLVTFLVYILIPELRNLHGKCLTCYVLCLTFTYILLAISHLGVNSLPQHGCITTAILSQFSFLGAIFWLNVMCIDICLTYSMKRQSSESVHAYERKKFIIYSAYAWSCTLVIVLISIIMDFSPGIPEHFLKPRFGQSRCWFERKIEAFVFFYGPFSILISCNIIMYIFTAIKLYQLKKTLRNVSSPQGRTRVDKENHIRFKLYLKLLLIMGIIWAGEIVGWAIDGPDYYWYLVDVINCLQGVLIFIIFVWQKRVRKIVVMKLWPQVGERQSTGWSFFDKCCMIKTWSPNRASETRDTSSSTILSPPKDNIRLRPMEETSKMNDNETA